MENGFIINCGNEIGVEEIRSVVILFSIRLVVLKVAHDGLVQFQEFN